MVLYHAASVRRPAKTIALLLLLAAIASACTGSSEPTPTRSGEPTDEPTVQTSFTPGRFAYSNAGLDVTLDMTGNTGTMKVDNGTGYDLDKPDLYVIDGVDGHRIEGKVLDAAAVADGDTATFDVQFPPEVNEEQIGLVILLFGSDNYGAFAPA